MGKESACNAGDQGSIPGLGRSSGEGNGNPLWYSCLENPMNRGAWQATDHAVARVGHDLATKSPSPELLLRANGTLYVNYLQELILKRKYSSNLFWYLYKVWFSLKFL